MKTIAAAFVSLISVIAMGREDYPIEQKGALAPTIVVVRNSPPLIKYNADLEKSVEPVSNVMLEVTPIANAYDAELEIGISSGLKLRF